MFTCKYSLVPCMYSCIVIFGSAAMLSYCPHQTIIHCSSHRDYTSLILRPHPSRACVYKAGLSVCMTLLSFYGSYIPNVWQKTDLSGLTSPCNHRVVISSMLTLDLRRVTVCWYPLDSHVQTVPPVDLYGT